MNTPLTQIADYILAQQGEIIRRWTGLVEGDTDVPNSENLTFRDLTNQIPKLCADLVARLRQPERSVTGKAARHPRTQGSSRWREGSRLEELIREAALLRGVFLEVVREFSRARKLKNATQREAEKIINGFIDDTLAESAAEFGAAGERALQDVSSAKEAGDLAAQRLAAIIESSDDAIISKDLNGVITSWNAGAQRLFGYTAQETVGRSVTILMPYDRHNEEPKILERIRRGERVDHYETIRRRKDGTQVNISLSISPIKDAEGRVIGASKIARNITDRVRHERWREAEVRIATLVAGPEPPDRVAPRLLEILGQSGPWVHAGLWLVNAEGELFCHSTWRAAGGVPTEFEKDTRTHVMARGGGVVGRVFAESKPSWITDVTRETGFARATTAASNGLHGAVFFPLVGSEGTAGVIELVSDTVLPRDDDLVRLTESLGIQIGLYLQRKKAEEELRRQKEAAESANQAKDRFLAALSHELRTPLNPVLIWACATVDREQLEPDLREGLLMVCRNVELEARLIDDLLDLTRISRGKLQLNRQPCRADELLRHALEIVRSQASAKELQIELEWHASNHHILGDATRVQQIFWNLLKNAIRFTPGKGRVRIRSYDAGPGALAIEISDTGPGLDADVIPKLFTAFEQGSRSMEGLGLGLAICKAILDMHGATITAANRPGSGAVFTVTFKTIAAALATRPAPAKPVLLAPRRLRILIVEDHDYTATVMSKLLKRDGHQVTTAASVHEALDVLKQSQFDLLLSDLGLPDGNGFQVMRELSKVSRAKGIAVSGYGMDEDVERSSEAGFSAHLTKPINVQELQETIQLVTGEW